MSRSRQNRHGIPVSIREWIVCTLATLTLVFTAWSLGGYETWALHLLFLGGLGTFIASVVPMSRSWNGFDQQHGNLKNFKRLLSQPFFWASVCFLVYVLMQYFNPSVVQVFGEKSWWVEPMTPPLGADLPSSVKADYETMNALRTFVIQAAAMGLACGILVGIQRRKPALIILWSFVISGVTMSFVAILQKLSGTDKLLWVVDTVNPYPWGTFAYRNQAAAFLILVLLISGLLYFFYKRRAFLKRQQGGPHFLLFLFIFLVFGSVWLALSRGGIILGSILVICFCFLALISHLKGLDNSNSWIISVIFLFIIIISGTFFFQLFDIKEIKQRLNHFNEIVANIETYDRTLSTKATWEMAEDRLMYGWGAGSFRYVFPIYQKNYEAIWQNSYYKEKGVWWRKMYYYAHNDWVQFLAEYGIVGCLFIGLLFLLLLCSCFSILKISFSAIVLLLCGLSLIFVHNFVDFIFSCPAYWVAYWGSLFLVARVFNRESKFCGEDTSS